jgi:hypothetical protein
MAGCTLLSSAKDAPFVHFFNYSSRSNILDPPQTQFFNASVHQQQYASGGTIGYERAFYVVLFAVFFINIWILISWFWHRDWYVDFSDPVNLFALAINSPPSLKLAEQSCDDDSKDGDRFKQIWRLSASSGGHVIMDSPEIDLDGEDKVDESPAVRRRRAWSKVSHSMASPATKVAKWTKLHS